ncbi:hypothetical protein K443DRAFT_125515 [Laccaria amethystina LaAM-08-1]|uniref:DUF6532 domain-containing protein n=1 Tax=Laccaria amethystina LaAM-08-1 TaxID=1095629 RepID=A0A0C9XBP7_9AGAR|nr:hypothetical protein K443DRAFT_125515 [Laccaria amethystina LaAM-08-1]
MAPKSQPIMDNRSAADKRRDTINKKKLEEQAHLRQIEAAGKVDRSSKLAAMKEAPWKGAAPTGPYKCGASPERSAGFSISEVRQGKKARIAGGVRTSTPKPKPTSRQTASMSKGLKRGKDTIPAYKQNSAPQLASSTRRRPVVIDDSDDDEGAEDLSQRKRKDDNPESDDEDDGYAAGGGEPEDEDRDLDDDQDLDVSQDLQMLSGQELKVTLRKEHPQWKGAAHSDEDDEDGADIPDPNFCDVTTASEINPTAADDDEEDEDEGEGHDQDDDDINEVESQPHGRRTTQNGKRAADRCAEVPHFMTTAAGGEPADDGNDSGPEGSLDIDDDPNQDPNEGWAIETHYNPPGRGKHNISIKAQPYILRMIIKAAIRRVTGDAIGETAYSPLDDATKYFRRTLKRCAFSLGATLYASRFAQDHHFGVVFGRVLNGRLSTYRGGMKKVVLSKVEGFYQLAGGAEGKAKVADLINQTSYIYPLRGDLLLRTKPFFNLAIISMLREVFFMGTRGTLAEKHEDRFKTTSDYPVNMKRRQVTDPMVALAATCVHSALDDFATGTCLKTEFNADLYEDVYHGHIKFLTEIRETNPEGYSKLMADLYNAVCSAITRRTTAVANNTMALLDIANLDV